jgi:hypothetical protein
METKDSVPAGMVIVSVRDIATINDDVARLSGDVVNSRAILDAVREALGPTCADATHEALPGLVRVVVQCDGATHERCDEQRDEIAALRGEVATARAEGAREMREAAAKTIRRFFMIYGYRAEDGWQAEERIHEIPLPGEEV